jgi:hypothetical protein
MRWLFFAKLSLYWAVALVIVEGLLALSAHRLEIHPAIQWWLLGVGFVSSLSLVGLTVGLGAAWIDPTAQDAARVVSSSRGALALVLMLGYVGCVAWAMVLAWTSWHRGRPEGMLLASVTLGGISLLAGWLPVRRGLARIERLDEETP